MEDGVNLNDPFVRLREKNTPVANPEAKSCSSLQSLDVAGSRFRVLLDAGNDAAARSWINPAQIAASPS